MNKSFIFMTALVLMFIVFTIPTYAVDGVDVEIRNGKLQIGGSQFGNADSESAWNRIISQTRGIIVGISGVGAVVMLGFFILNFLKLGASAGNPTARSQAVSGLLWTGIATAGLGSVALFMGIFYNLLR